ncbi:SRPBCC domain-containing protein [Sphingobacterium paramultivorum]|uniref:SRPBCC domain-containing protein n=1 Tax=Sphingobacterium paramultivorum TaxID=2886510 RepID=A0A7G5E5E2_9SPHI|nr:SRPBCC domain-containing protein [Sphingobacterium paramultivorum]QMV69217.1 SRPBCC domain-containing protein [Sphingobacterium paramultivorum]WSO13007.1 SRPBCC domain-containing protein [Sphingobacterium paramultivorum]
MKKIETSILIDATAEEVWQVLSEFKAYPQWSPTIKQFEKQPVVGKRCKVFLEQPNGFKIKMNPKFLSIERNRELRWKGNLFFPGIFDGEHYFRLEQVGATQVRFVQGELFSGLLVPFLGKLLIETKRGFDLFNMAIKRRVEYGS